MFAEAKPVWPAGLEEEKNIHAGFRTVFSGTGKTTLKLAGSTLYRVFLNGEFIQHGPARGPHGFYRIDELDLSGQMKDGENLLAIEVVGINCHSFAYLNQPSFLQAEIEADGKIIAATGGNGFEALRLPERIQRVERYSFQRPYVEAYRIAPGFDDWRKRTDAAFEPVRCAVQEERKFLPRGVALSNFEIKPAENIVRSGSVTVEERPVDRSVFWWTGDPRYPGLKSFPSEEFELDVLQIIQSCSFTEDKTFGTNRWQILDLGVNLTGFIQLAVSCKQPVRLMAVFDEVLMDGDLNLDRNKSINLIYYDLQPGTYELESMEPYTFRYLKLIALDGEVTVHQAGLREYANAEASSAEFECADPDLNRIFEAGRQTFRQNATDLYMDCPGRERAGWLCDSFFTGRVEPLLCGGSKVERNFIENFALPADFLPVPKGMLPMCYPSEHPDGRHIPQWAMWMVLELEEYLQRTGDRTMIDRMESKIGGLLDYFKGFENSDGLLEKLPSWNFIEWSKANELTQDVNYPTNMLYARMLESAARLYGKDELLQKAREVHETVRQQSFVGTFFVDNSVRDAAGVLKSSGESTEVCQYYAFFCGTASPESHPELWRILLKEFGPNRDPEHSYSAVHPANAFIGYYLRMELLSRYGEREQLLHEIKGYFFSMAKTTGTLWEHNDTRASCNHGFASHICAHLIRDLAGIRTFDPVHRRIVLSEETSLIGTFRCSLPAGAGRFELQEKDGVRKWHQPEGWALEPL